MDTRREPMTSARPKRPRHPIPPDVRIALNGRGLLSAYRARPPYQQNDYIGWITRAKLKATRERRIEQMLTELDRGDRYMKMKYAGNTTPAPREFFDKQVGHQIYAGDTPLHIAAAGYAVDVARSLLAEGADVLARNRRGATPLHYAADGHPGGHLWNPRAQAAVIVLLIRSGADANATDKSGVAPLHRAVRTRSTGAVRALIANGASARQRNKSGSTPLQLALQTTGRGGSGAAVVREEQEKIIAMLREVDR